MCLSKAPQMIMMSSPLSSSPYTWTSSTNTLHILCDSFHLLLVPGEPLHLHPLTSRTANLGPSSQPHLVVLSELSMIVVAVVLVSLCSLWTCTYKIGRNDPLFYTVNRPLLCQACSNRCALCVLKGRLSWWVCSPGVQPWWLEGDSFVNIFQRVKVASLFPSVFAA